MKQWNRHIILVYCTAHIYLEHGRWYSAGFVDVLVCVGDAVILDTTEWESAGGGWHSTYSASECCHRWDQRTVWRPAAQEPLKNWSTVQIWGK